MVRRSAFALALASLLVLGSVPIAAAQDGIVGDWKGTIAGQLDMIFHITEQETDDGMQLEATLDVPMQNTFGLPMDSVTFTDGTVRMTLDIVGGVCEGKLGDDGTIEGQWTQTQAPQPQTLNLMRQEES